MMREVIRTVMTLIAGFIFLHVAYTIHFKGVLERKKFLMSCLYAIACMIVAGGFATYVANGFR